MPSNPQDVPPPKGASSFALGAPTRNPRPRRWGAPFPREVWTDRTPYGGLGSAASTIRASLGGGGRRSSREPPCGGEHVRTTGTGWAAPPPEQAPEPRGRGKGAGVPVGVSASAEVGQRSAPPIGSVGTPPGAPYKGSARQAGTGGGSVIRSYPSFPRSFTRGLP